MRENTWISLLSDDPEQTGDYSKVKTTAFFPDLGITIVRDDWKNPDAVAAMFKCGPPGGYELNSWRLTGVDALGKAEAPGKLAYIDVAHEHPDANSFEIFGDGDYMAETDRYPLKPGKLSSSLNTILVNGMGQTPEGRPEGEGWLQPSSKDMTKMGVITAWKDAGDVVVAEGEASGSYMPETDRKTIEKSARARPLSEDIHLGQGRIYPRARRRSFTTVGGDHVVNAGAEAGGGGRDCGQLYVEQK